MDGLPVIQGMTAPKKVNTLERQQSMGIYNNEVEHTWKQLIASSTLPASLSALPYER